MADARASRSSFELRWVVVPPDEYTIGKRYLDFVVDGQSLRDRLEDEGGITLLGWLLPHHYAPYVGELLLTAPPSLPEGRVPIYVCPACADPGCGVLTAVIRREGDVVIWEDFVRFAAVHGEPGAYEVSTSPHARRRHEGVGPFRFDAASYEATLRSALALLASTRAAKYEDLARMVRWPNPVALADVGVPSIEVITQEGVVDLHSFADFLGFNHEPDRSLQLHWRLGADDTLASNGRHLDVTLAFDGLDYLAVTPADPGMPRSEDAALDHYLVLEREGWRVRVRFVFAGGIEIEVDANHVSLSIEPEA